MFSRTALPLVALAVLGACADRDTPRTPLSPSESVEEPVFLISDAPRGGAEGFYFLTPLVPSPSFTGTFDGSFTPIVEVCELSGGACGAVVASFSGAEVTVDLVDEAYSAVWHTSESGLDPAEDYRIQVRLGDLVLGFADIDVVASGRERRDVDESNFVAVLNGTTVPIRFRIEADVLEHLFVSVAAGGFHACGLTAAGAAFCWGSNFSGELGNGGNTSSLVPVAVVGGLTFAALAAGGELGFGSGDLTCGLTPAGSAYCWGESMQGELGNGSTTNSNVPVAVTGGHTFQSLDVGGHGACGVTTTGEGYCWGLRGILGAGPIAFESCTFGDGVVPCSTTPVAVAGGLTFASISVGRSVACGVTPAGQAYCWGGGGGGGLGNGGTADSDVPVAVAGGHSFASVSAGRSHACGVTTSGQAYCWGEDLLGQLGDGAASAESCGLRPCSTLPIAVAGEHVFSSVSAGNFGTCALTPAGAAHCWGTDDFGALGDGTAAHPICGGGPFVEEPCATAPVAVQGGLSFRSLSRGMFRFACAVTASGRAYCWGLNNSGQLGDGSMSLGHVPVAVLAP